MEQPHRRHLLGRRQLDARRPARPGAIATFPLGTSYAVTFGANATTFRHVVNQGTVTWNLNGFTFANTDTISNGIGNSGTATSLRVVNGTLLPGNFDVGGNNAFVTSAVFDQAVSATIGSGAFHIGAIGIGTLAIQGTSTVTTTGGSAGVGISSSGVGSFRLPARRRSAARWKSTC